MNRTVTDPRLLGAWCAALAALNAGNASAQTPPGSPLQPPAPPPGSSGSGLEPPPLLAPTAEANTEHQLQLAEQKDSKRGLQFVLLNADAGTQWSSLTALSDSGLLDSDADATGLGLALGAGLALRLLYLTAGARFRFAKFGSYDMWSLGLEGNLRIPRGALEPYAHLGAGYVQAGSFTAKNDTVTAEQTAVLDDVSVRGVNVRLGVGFDYFITPVFSAGVSLDGELLILGRAALPSAPEGSLYHADGSAVGLAVSGLASLGLHF